MHFFERMVGWEGLSEKARNSALLRNCYKQLCYNRLIGF